jgi:hypothetical protein
MSSLSLTVLTAAEPAGRELPMPPVMFGVISIALFLLALLFLWSFRNTAAKTDPRNFGGHGQKGRQAHRAGHAEQHGDTRTQH